MKPLARFFLALWIIASGGMGSPDPCVADGPITLRVESTVRSGVVRLSDLFTNVPVAFDRDIAQAPPPDKPAVYGANVLEKLADKYHLDWHPESIADHVTVTGIATRITEDMIRRAIVQKVRDTGAKGDIDVGFDNKAIELNLPADQSPDFTLSNFTYDSLTKRFRTELTTENAQNPLQVPIAGRVVIKLRVPVLAHRLDGGTVIGAADLDSMSISDDRVGEAVVTDASQLIGHELRRSTADGEILHVSDIIPPRLVTRGGIVTLKIESAFMTLTAQGKCLQDGTKGETVRVINTQSNRTIEGIVEGTGVVIVPVAQKLADAQ